MSIVFIYQLLGVKQVEKKIVYEKTFWTFFSEGDLDIDYRLQSTSGKKEALRVGFLWMLWHVKLLFHQAPGFFELFR